MTYVVDTGEVHSHIFSVWAIDIYMQIIKCKTSVNQTVYESKELMLRAVF